MKKLVMIGLLAVFAVACTKPETNSNELEEYGTPKDKAVNSKGSSTENDLEDELDDTEY